jgi:hypothetical protein
MAHRSSHVGHRIRHLESRRAAVLNGKHRETLVEQGLEHG